jgi:hypothetical protein
MPDSKPIKTETYELDGIAYEISIHERDQGFSAQWTCPSCNYTNGVPGAYQTSVESIDRAKAHLFTLHHVPRHLLSGTLPSGHQ